MTTWIYLGIAIIGEVIATSALKASEGFTQLVPSLITIFGYAFAFYFLAQSLREIPLGLAYAIWSGVGIVIISIIGHFVFKQHLDWMGILGIALIVGGVLILNIFSKTSTSS